MRLASLFALSAFASVVAACGGNASQEPAPGSNMAQSRKPRDLSPVVEIATTNALQKANGAFAHDLYGKLVASSPTANAAFSPYSVSVALAMTYAGAATKTADEMSKTLHVDGIAPDKVHAAFDALDLQLDGREKSAHPSEGATPFQLHVVNSLWGSPTDQWGPGFLDTLSVDYGAGVRLTDFATNPEGARTEINAWVSDQTESKIPTLLDPGTITNDTRIVLVDAMYFHGSWAHPFDPSLTQNLPFHTLDGNSPAVPAMSTSDEMQYAGGADYDAVMIPYDGVPLVMTVVVPKDGTSFTDFESKFDGNALDALEASATIAEVNLQLPKFTIKGSSISLARALSELGMPDAFTVNADFSPMTASEAIVLSDVIHQTFVSVDEKGTEAAAATAVIGVGLAAPSKTANVIADRPFLFFVRDLPTKTTLFQGRVVDPR
jgi:serpin B